LSPLQTEKILIRIDTAAQGYDYQPDIRILNKFDVFTEVRVTPEDVLLSQKIYTAVNRERPKGRDFYDITFLLGRTTRDYGFLELKMRLSQPEAVREKVLEEIKTYNFKKLAEDVSPFLISSDEVKIVIKFRAFWEQAKLD
jgi:hypothetical protein